MLVKQVVERIIQQAIDATDAEAGSVWLSDRDRAIISPVAALGPRSSGITGFSLRFGEGIVGRTAGDGREILLEEAADDPAWAFYFDAFSGFRTRSVLCVPLLQGHTPVGALQLLNKRGGGGFTQTDLVLARSLAREVLAALEADLPDG